MIIDQIYQRRFDKTDERKILWGVLVDRFFQKYINKNDTVLDVPCGYGEFINAIKCKQKLALDINPDSKKYLNKNVKFLKSSSTKIPLARGSVDKIFVSNFFEHISHSDIQKTVVEFKRVLKKGGQVLVLQPNIRFAANDYWMFFDHITPVDDRALEEVFAINGFTLKKRILRFMPFTSQSRLPVNRMLVSIYLSLPFVWRILGKQTFLIFQKWAYQ